MTSTTTFSSHSSHCHLSGAGRFKAHGVGRSSNISGVARLLFGRMMLTILVMIISGLSLTARAQTNVEVLTGSGELQQWNTTANVELAVPMTFRWWTTAPGTTGARWDVEVKGTSNPIATSNLTGSPDAAHPGSFTLPAGTFLAPQTPATPVSYTLHVTPLHGSTAGAPSLPVLITQGKAGTADVSQIGEHHPKVAPEPGHPVAILVAYKPIPQAPVHGKQEGLIVLEFSNSGSAPTDEVFVTVSDLKQVVTQTDKQVLVPRLNAGGRFRVSVALGPFVITSDANTQNWLKRYAQGLSLLVGTAKVHSPFVQDQQPPILTGPAARCVGEGCGTTSPPWVANFRPNLTNIDSSIAAGQDFLYTGDYNNFDVFAKKARESVDISKTDLSSSNPVAQLAWENGGAANLFRDFWYPGASRNVNPGVLPPNRVIPCDPTQPVQRDPSDSTGQTLKKNNGFVTSACINDFYDSRVTYDEVRRRFWIVTHARNELWNNDHDAPCGPLSRANCDAAHAEAVRLMLVAVSKSESPAAGFNKSLVDNFYQDWPILSVRGDYAFFFYHDPVRLKIYDADKLTQGVVDELKPDYTPNDFNNGVIRLPKHHGNTSNLTYLTAPSGDRMRVFAFRTTRGRPLLLQGGSYVDSNGDKFDTAYDNYQAAFRSGYLYLSTDDGKRVLVWRMRVVLSPDGKSVGIDAKQTQKWVIKDTSGENFNFDYSTIDVNSNSDVVASFRAWKSGVPDQVWFAVLYNGENAFRTPKVLSAPSSGGPSGQRTDFVSSSVDPGDEETIWIIGRDGTGAIVASVRP